MRRKFKVVVNGKEYTVEVEEVYEEAPKKEIINVSKSSAPVQRPQNTESVKKEGAVLSPMPGKVLSVKVSVGDEVNAGDVLLTLEAMKMENEIVAPNAGVIKEVNVKQGDNVERNAVLVVIE